MNRSIIAVLAVFAILCSSAFADSCTNQADGHSFTSSDGCNTCTCINGIAACTEIGCGGVSDENKVVCTDGTHTLFATPFDAYCSPNSAVDSVSETQVAVGCTQETNCIEMVTFAQSPNGEKYVFANGCLPEGFSSFDGVCGVTCTASQITVSATPFDQSCTSIFAEPAPVGCVDANLICPQVITYAADAAGKIFVFNNGCVPEGFIQTNIMPTCEDITGCPAQYRPSRAILASNFCSVGIQAETEIVGCIQSNLMCASMPLYAASPKGIVYYFPFGCVPLGFTIVPVDCADIMAAESCPANSRVVTASPFHSFCSGGENVPSIGVGCIESDAMCTQQVTFAKNSKGDTFVFGSGCIPETFTRVDETCPGICDAGFKPVSAVDASAHCWGAAPGVSVSEAVVGCVEENLMCITVETFARERGTGAISVFSTPCLPPNYEVLPYVSGCADLVCLETDCGSVNRVCQPQQVQCFTTPCPMIPSCVESNCYAKAPFEEFQNNCGATCFCDGTGTMMCDECEKESSSSDDKIKSNAVIAAGSVGVAAASVAAFVGYRKYFNKDRAFSFRTKSTYATMDESA